MRDLIFPRQPTWQDWLALVVRLVLVVAFVGYGVTKLSGGQFDYSDWTISKSGTPGEDVVWAFYGYSPFYGHVAGLYELLPALLLVFRRTVLLGALGLFAVTLNITLMDFSYDVSPGKYLILFFCLLCVVLIGHERRRLFALVA